MDVNEDDNSPLAGAVRFWQLACSDDPGERALIGGLLHPVSRQRPAQILDDFHRLDRPALASRLEASSDPTVFYALIIEGAETIGGQLVETHAASRYLTLKWVEALKYWSVYHYGADRAEPTAIPD